MKKKLFLFIAILGITLCINDVKAEGATDGAALSTNPVVEEDTSSYTEEWKELVESVKEYYLDTDFYVVSTENTLTVVTTIEEKTYETNFVYEEGILKYVLNSDLDSLVVDTKVVNDMIEIYCNNKEYTEDFNIQQNQAYLSIERNGIYYEENLLETDEAVVVAFELDVKNGIRAYDNDGSTILGSDETNPDTGIYYASGAVILIALTGAAIYLVSRKYSKFPQA